MACAHSTNRQQRTMRLQLIGVIIIGACSSADAFIITPHALSASPSSSPSSKMQTIIQMTNAHEEGTNTDDEIRIPRTRAQIMQSAMTGILGITAAATYLPPAAQGEKVSEEIRRRHSKSPSHKQAS